MKASRLLALGLVVAELGMAFAWGSPAAAKRGGLCLRALTPKLDTGLPTQPKRPTRLKGKVSQSQGNGRGVQNGTPSTTAGGPTPPNTPPPIVEPPIVEPPTGPPVSLQGGGGLVPLTPRQAPGAGPFRLEASARGERESTPYDQGPRLLPRVPTVGTGGFSRPPLRGGATGGGRPATPNYLIVYDFPTGLFRVRTPSGASYTYQPAGGTWTPAPDQTTSEGRFLSTIVGMTHGKGGTTVTFSDGRRVLVPDNGRVSAGQSVSALPAGGAGAAFGGTTVWPAVYTDAAGATHLAFAGGADWVWNPATQAFQVAAAPPAAESRFAAEAWVTPSGVVYAQAGARLYAWNPFVIGWAPAQAGPSWSAAGNLTDTTLSAGTGVRSAVAGPGPAAAATGAGAALGGLAGLALAAVGPVGLGMGVAVGAVVGGGAGLALGLAAPALAGCGSPQPAPPPPCFVCNLQPPEPPIYAPDLFLYAPRPERVEVRLGGAAVPSASMPAYGGGWTVVVGPDGALRAGAGGRAYGHLFYDLTAPVPWQTARGWVVSSSEWPRWVITELPRLGLRGREVTDFARDWTVGHLPPAPYYLVAPQSQAVVDAVVPLELSPAAGTVYRLWLYVVPLRAPVRVPAPHVPVLGARRGLTAVEWGVAFPAGVAPPCTPEVDCPSGA